jgi:hypothetical protein
MADTRALSPMLLLVIVLLLAANLFRDGAATSSPSRSAPVPTRRLEQVTERLAAAVEKLDVALARQPSAAETQPRPVTLLPTPAGAPEPPPTAAQVPPKNERRIRELRLNDVESKTILRDYAFQTYADILEEFGFPDDIWLGGSEIRFVYEFPGPDGHKRNLIFAFVGGIVMGVSN